MEPQVIEKPTLRIAGVNLPGGWDQRSLILNLWVAFAAKRHLITGAKNPTVLYGLWHRKTGKASEVPAYLVGVEVDESFLPPAGITVLTVPSGRYAAIAHPCERGSVLLTYDTLMNWVEAQGFHFRSPAAPTLEIYDTDLPVGHGCQVVLCEPIA